MFAVVFEVQPRRERFDDYLAHAKMLRPHLERIDGFIDNERFASKRTEGRLLSLSIWRDEKAVIRWRTHAGHHVVQEKGRLEILADYHLRVGEITRDTQAVQVVLQQKRFDETEICDAKVLTISPQAPGEGAPEALVARLGLDLNPAGLVDHEMFESITNPGKLVVLASWTSAGTARALRADPALRHLEIRVIRDYGMFERREAPQYYPEVKA
jgi:heme-degrading monooxygenase HmoA